MTFTSNTTRCSTVDGDPLAVSCFHTAHYPVYYTPSESLINGVSDHILTAAAPLLAYWSLSLFFHYLDMSGWEWLEKYRIHDSAEVAARNRATRSQVVWAVVLQQAIQTALAFVWLSDEPFQQGGHAQRMHDIARSLQPFVYAICRESYGHQALTRLVPFVYWWGIPIFQFLAAMFCIDTWQYFLHRLMHVNKFLYRNFHSWHHRLYVPYAFGALYNHPVEGFLLDSLGAVLAEWITAMTTRQAMLLFSISTFKTVDDHCGYSLPFDPLQIITKNNANYHDIHHQVIGMKSNFSQPFFIHWDAWMGTRMTRHDIELRKGKNGKAS